jgi:polyhydroxyalkanoate synthesis repressor PhaR
MSEPRVIKKYPNRRLYDTVESRYITLEDIRKLVVEQVDFVVMDKLTQEDITNGILLQVISEQEHGSEPMMSREFLSQLIRCYGGGAMQHLAGCCLEQTLKLFAHQRRELRERAKSLIGVDPYDAAAAVAPKNFQRWRSAQDEIFRTLLDVSPHRTRGETD